MKLLFIMLLALPLLCHTHPAEVVEKSLSLEEEVQLDSEHASSDKDSSIQKRSGGEGSFSYVTQIKTGLLSSLGHASASIASGSSGSSSGGGSYKSIDAHHGNSVDYDPWSFKKSLLNTIFQAVKAITGGVTALKGQLIKGSGYALSASGHVVATGGDKVTDVGKAIINSAHQNTPTYGPPSHGGGGGYVHPFAKFSSLSGASSSSSSGSSDGSHPSKPGPVIHTETITAYEIPAGHANYGPPSKPPTYSSATHQYLPPQSSAGYGGGSPFVNGHVAFEAPSHNYLPTSYDVRAGNNEYNLYGGHKKLTDEEARRAAVQLQEILNMLPNGKTEYTASKTVALNPYASNDINPEHVELQNYGLGPLESLSHTESVTAAYGPRPQEYLGNAADIYRQMEKKQKKSPEEIYIQKHPEEGYYDYTPPKKTAIQDYHYNNYHVAGKEGGQNNQGVQDLTPIIAALEATKRRGPTQNQYNTQYTIEKNVQKLTTGSPYSYLPPVVQKSKLTYYESGSKSNNDKSALQPPVPYKIHQIISGRTKRKTKPTFRDDYELQDPFIFNHVMML